MILVIQRQKTCEKLSTTNTEMGWGKHMEITKIEQKLQNKLAVGIIQLIHNQTHIKELLPFIRSNNE